MAVVDEIKERVDVVEFISQYVPLRKAGRNYKGLCPFHADTSPSFIVFPEGQRWHCFGACGTGGDIFTFLMKRENLDFSEALRLLAQRAGIELAPRTEQQKEKDERGDLLREINLAAAQYFHHLLLNAPQAQGAREYLQRRQLQEETWGRFQLGYSLPDWEALVRHLQGKGYQEADIFAAGLTVEREGGGCYDRFRGRLVFPIHDGRGGVVGFGGRALDDSTPKYVNTPQTPLFDKSSLLYGLHLAREAIRAEGLVVIVEGYMDVLMAHQHAFRNVVASMGTALTESQVAALRRLTKNFTLAMDADAAGQEASLRGLEVVKQTSGIEHRQSPEVREVYRHISLKKYVDANIKIIVLPEGLDPDEVIKEDPGRWSRLLEEALPLMDYYFHRATGEHDLGSAAGKSALVRQLLPLIEELSDAVEQAHYLQKLARLARIDERTLAAGMTRTKRQGKARAPGNDGQAAPVLEASHSLENYCLALLIHAPQLANEARRLTADDFLATENRSIFLAFQSSLEGETGLDLEDFRIGLDPVLGEHMDTLLASLAKRPELPEEELAAEMDRALARLRDRKDRQDLLELESLLSDPLSSEADELALRVRVEDLRQRISERQRLRQGRIEWAQGGLN